MRGIHSSALSISYVLDLFSFYIRKTEAYVIPSFDSILPCLDLNYMKEMTDYFLTSCLVRTFKAPRVWKEHPTRSIFLLPKLRDKENVSSNLWKVCVFKETEQAGRKLGRV